MSMVASTGLSALVLSLTTASTGPIISISEHVTWSGNTSSFAVGALESSEFVRLFDERVMILTEPLAVDTLAFNGLPGLGDGHPASLPAGTSVLSLLLHFDPTGQPASPADISAWISSDGPVALIYSDALLDASDSMLGRSGTTYPTGVAGRGLESDLVQITEYGLPNGRRTSTTTVNWSESGSGIDSMRVIIAFNFPEPASATLLITAGTLLSLRRGSRV